MSSLLSMFAVEARSPFEEGSACCTSLVRAGVCRNAQFEQAIVIITEGRGCHFDPDIADACLAIADTFNDIVQRFRDEA